MSRRETGPFLIDQLFIQEAAKKMKEEAKKIGRKITIKKKRNKGDTRVDVRIEFESQL